jgi:hypothetical protein
MVWLQRSSDVDLHVVRLARRQCRQLDAEVVEVQARNLLVEQLRQRVHSGLVAVLDQTDLRQHLVGERARHHKRRVAGGAAEIDEAALRKQQHGVAVGEGVQIDLRLDLGRLDARKLLQLLDLDLVVKVADVAGASSSA